jgi:hypothetical protein
MRSAIGSVICRQHERIFGGMVHVLVVVEMAHQLQIVASFILSGLIVCGIVRRWTCGVPAFRVSGCPCRRFDDRHEHRRLPVLVPDKAEVIIARTSFSLPG